MLDRMKVVLLWHMHQPFYRDMCSNQYQLPWTYLHGIKDYVEMAAHLEAVPNASAVINFAPTLLEQLDDYTQQIKAFLQQGTPICDPLLMTLVRAPLFPPELSKDEAARHRFWLVEQCLRINWQHVIHRFKPYDQLAEIAGWVKQKPEFMLYLDEQYFIDLTMWYHLGWLGETVRRQDERVQGLLKKARGFTQEDRHLLLAIVGELLESIVPRYRLLAKRGQIELSLTPYAHPIMPLLLDLRSAQEAVPDMELPNVDNYPEGHERVRWHLREALNTFKKYFGITPQGCWPSEGSLSEDTIRIMEEFGIRWTASGEQVLRNSLNQSGLSEQETHQVFQLSGSTVKCFFRDDNLSDAIGFQYAKWHADNAVGDLLHHLENIVSHSSEKNVVVIALDGENAWESFHENGFYFLSTLYHKLSTHPRLKLTTLSRCLNLPTVELPHLVAGSWVYGTFTTWIGDKDKNRGWEMLVEAKRVFDQKIQQLSPEQQLIATQQLSICEGSDWCWWFGDYNPTDAVHDFEHLYRLHLSHLYRLLGEPVPDYLQHAFTHGGGHPALGGVMRTGKEHFA